MNNMNVGMPYFKQYIQDIMFSYKFFENIREIYYRYRKCRNNHVISMHHNHYYTSQKLFFDSSNQLCSKQGLKVLQIATF